MNIGIAIAVAGILAVIAAYRRFRIVAVFIALLFAEIMGPPHGEDRPAMPAPPVTPRGEDRPATALPDQHQAAEIVRALTTPCWQRSGCAHLFGVEYQAKVIAPDRECLRYRRAEACCPPSYQWDDPHYTCRLASSFRPDPVP